MINAFNLERKGGRGFVCVCVCLTVCLSDMRTSLPFERQLQKGPVFSHQLRVVPSRAEAASNENNFKATKK